MDRSLFVFLSTRMQLTLSNIHTWWTDQRAAQGLVSWTKYAVRDQTANLLIRRWPCSMSWAIAISFLGLINQNFPFPFKEVFPTEKVSLVQLKPTRIFDQQVWSRTTFRNNVTAFKPLTRSLMAVCSCLHPQISPPLSFNEMVFLVRNAHLLGLTFYQQPRMSNHFHFLFIYFFLKKIYFKKNFCNHTLKKLY